MTHAGPMPLFSGNDVAFVIETVNPRLRGSGVDEGACRSFSRGKEIAQLPCRCLPPFQKAEDFRLRWLTGSVSHTPPRARCRGTRNTLRFIGTTRRSTEARPPGRGTSQRARDA